MNLFVVRTGYWSIVGLLSVCPAIHAQGFQHTVLAKTGDNAPGTSLQFGVPSTASDPLGFGFSVNNPAATSAFFGRVNGPGVTGNVNDIGVWTSSAGNLQLVARIGDTAPGSGGAVYAVGSTFGLGLPAVSADGSVAYRAFLSGTGVTTSNDVAIYSRPASGSSQLLARKGDVASASTGTAVFASFSDPQVRANGSVLFSGSLSGSGITTTNDVALFTGTAGNLQVVAREGDVAPNTAGATFSQVNGSFSTNANGSTVFRGNLVIGGSVTAANSVGIWAGTSGNTNLVLRAADNAPGIGTAITAFGGVGILATGEAAINATVATGGSVTTANNQGLFIGTNQANAQLVVRKGDQVPGAVSGLIVGGIGIPIGGSNTVAFRTVVAGTGVTTGVNDRALFSWSAANGLTMIARQGDVAPGTSGALFGALGSTNPVFGTGVLPGVGPTGDVIFYSPLTGSGVNTTNDAGIWLYSGTTLRLVAREGDVIDLDPGVGVDLATISSLSTSESLLGNAGGTSALANGTQLTWSAQFTDGRYAVFNSSIAAVPEPATLAAVAAGLLGAGIILRRRWIANLSHQEVQEDNVV